MRKLMYFSMGFAVSCGVCVYIDGGLWKYPIAAALILMLCLIGRKRSLMPRVLTALLGCMIGFSWYTQFYNRYLSSVVELNGKTVPLAIRAADFGQEEANYTFVDGTVHINGNTYRIQVRLKDSVAVEPGQKFAGTWYLRAVDTGIKPGYGIFLAAYQDGTVTVGKTQKHWLDKIAYIHRDIQHVLKNTFPVDVHPFARALLLGDTSELSYQTDTDLKISGIRHVVAVSGLHISILLGLISLVTFRKRLLTALLGYPTLLFFAAVTGFTPSVVRACLMWSLILLARLAGREYDGPTSLGFAVLVMLLVNPPMITDAGFQLSVASVAGIFLFEPGLLLWLRSFFGELRGKSLRCRLIRWMTASLSVTIAASVLTVPLCAYYFDMVSLIGMIGNLLTLWVISGIFYGIMAVCLVYWLIPTVSVLLAAVIAWPIRYVLWIAGILADFPLAAVYTASPYITAWLVFVYVMLAVFLISENRRPVIFTCCAVIGLCIALVADWSESMTDDVRLTILDVGQGQSVLLQSDGCSFLVDCGGDYAAGAADTAAQALLRQGIGKLDGLIVTHMDMDHSNGAQGLLGRMKTDLLILPEIHSNLPQYTDAQVICASEELAIAFGESVIRIFPPVFPGNSNEKSLCVLFDTQKCDILITGDRDGFGERALLRNADIPDVDVLIAGHHGAAASTCEELLAAVKPEIVCISVGAGNRYGHPAPETLQRISAFGCEIYRTDIQGTITIRR